MKLLMVEDDSLLRHLLYQRLRAHGYEVDLASTAEDALRLATEQRYALGIVDLGLPRKASVELIQALRRQHHDFPILVLTAHGRWQTKIDALRAGADDYLNKPFLFDVLQARLDALLERFQWRPADWRQPPRRSRHPVREPGSGGRGGLPA